METHGSELVLVTGAGRSGTSALAGLLDRLGANVPGPFLEANSSNPRGFYESSWSVTFHNALLKRAMVGIADGRPTAQFAVSSVVRDRERNQLRSWLPTVLDPDRLNVVKDPRILWTLDLWEEVTRELNVGLSYVIMARHPAEVVGSRRTHYGARVQNLAMTDFAVKNLAGWINTMLTVERQTRGRRRVLLRYDELVDDWRTAAVEMVTALELPLTVPGSGQAHSADTFVDRDLHRHRLDWTTVLMREDLQAIADRIWRACLELARNEADPGARNELDIARSEYDELYLAAQQLSFDHTSAAVLKATREAATPKAAVATQQDRPPPRRKWLARAVRLARRLCHRVRGWRSASRRG